MSEQDPSSADQAPEVQSDTAAESTPPSEGTPPPESPEIASTPTDAPPAEAAASGAKAELGKRALAMVIDMILVFIVGFVPAIGGLVGAAYMLLRDGLDLDFMNHRSIGKNVMKLHIDSLADAPIDPVTSMKRNWLFAFGPLIQASAWIPFIGWAFAILMLPVAAIAFLVEVVLVVTDNDGRRVGDKIANTVVRQD